MIEIPIVQHGKPAGMVRLTEQMYFDIRDLALVGRSVELVAGVVLDPGNPRLVEFHIKPCARGLAGGTEIIFNDNLKDSDDKEIMASKGDKGTLVGPFMDGYTVINKENGKEFYVEESEFTVVTK